MPKKVSAHRLAAQAIRLSDALSQALEGKFEIGLIEAALGHCSFRVLLADRQSRVVSITSRVLRGGRTSASRAERGHFLIVDDKEVIGVVNTAQDLKVLKKAGRVPASLLDGLDGCSGLDDFFEVDRSSVKEEQDIWGKRDEERLALAAEIESRIRRRRAGLAVKNALAPLLALDGEDAEVDSDLDDEPEVVVPAASDAPASEEEVTENRKIITSARRLRAMALKAAAEEAAIQAEIAKARAELEARWAVEDAEQEQIEKITTRAIPTSWEDEIDIDAI